MTQLQTILHAQIQTLRHFLHHPKTRTPTILLYVASFGGALHSAVTTYFYLAIGATEMDIGRLGFIMSVGALIGSPIVGWALDNYGVWIPISVTAAACSWGCLWRGVASSLSSLRMGAILLGIGINLWTVILAHLVKSFPSNMRSEVLSGFGVQTTVLQLCGKGVFPLLEYALHHGLKIEDTLLRYRIHMGMCTFFCFYGMFALFFDRKNIRDGETKKMKYLQKHSDVSEDAIEEGNNDNVAPAHHENHSNLHHDTPQSSLMAREIELAVSHPETQFEYENETNLLQPICETKNEEINSKPSKSSTSIESKQKYKQLIATITLTIALLLQSISTTIFTVLWPLLANDRFHLSAHTFGILTFSSSVVSTAAVAAFPVLERMEKVGGRVRCAALGFGCGFVLCVFFCICSFGGEATGAFSIENTGIGDNINMLGSMGNGDRSLSTHLNHYFPQSLGIAPYFLPPSNNQQQYVWIQQERVLQQIPEQSSTIIGSRRQNEKIHSNSGASEGATDATSIFQSRKQLIWHAISAMAFQASLSFLEPSLKSILSLVVISSSESPSSVHSKSQSLLGFTMGSMTTLASIGGMIGNLSGTWMYKLSKDGSISREINLSNNHVFSLINGGALPFIVTAMLLATSAVMVWRLDDSTSTNRSMQTPGGTRDENRHDLSTDECISLVPAKNMDIENRSAQSESSDDSVEGIRDSCCLALREQSHEIKLD